MIGKFNPVGWVELGSRSDQFHLPRFDARLSECSQKCNHRHIWHQALLQSIQEVVWNRQCVTVSVGNSFASLHGKNSISWLTRWNTWASGLPWHRCRPFSWLWQIRLRKQRCFFLWWKWYHPLPCLADHWNRVQVCAVLSHIYVQFLLFGNVKLQLLCYINNSGFIILTLLRFCFSRQSSIRLKIEPLRQASLCCCLLWRMKWPKLLLRSW